MVISYELVAIYIIYSILDIVNKTLNLRVQAYFQSVYNDIRGIHQIFPRNYLKNADVVKHDIQT